jgi:hypothetical protein
MCAAHHGLAFLDELVGGVPDELHCGERLGLTWGEDGQERELHATYTHALVVGGWTITQVLSRPNLTHLLEQQQEAQQQLDPCS